MITVRSNLKIMVASKPIDFRRGIHGLVALVADTLQADPYCGALFVFRSKRLDRLKMIAWDGSGMILVTKWLEQGRFVWPPIKDGAVRLSSVQMALLLDGLDWTRITPLTIKKPTITG